MVSLLTGQFSLKFKVRSLKLINSFDFDSAFVGGLLCVARIELLTRIRIDEHV